MPFLRVSLYLPLISHQEGVCRCERVVACFSLYQQPHLQRHTQIRALGVDQLAWRNPAGTLLPRVLQIFRAGATHLEGSGAQRASFSRLAKQTMILPVAWFIRL